jgi:catechol 2,3-dioxygenase-like lactoylglutathione lyase family enzyme
VHLRTADIDRIRSFYVDILGFDVVAKARDVTTNVTGLPSANACTAPGMLAVGTNAEETNTSGKTQMKPTDCAVSGLRTDIPT